jgi:DNA-binding transcriptional MerR regulator
MIATEPQVADNDRYSPKEASTLLGIHRCTLSKYTDSGAIKCGVRKANGRKYYTGTEIRKFWKGSY